MEMPYKGSPRTSAAALKAAVATAPVTASPSPPLEDSGADLLLSLAETASVRHVPQHLPSGSQDNSLPAINPAISVSATLQHPTKQIHSFDSHFLNPVTPSPLVHSKEIVGSTSSSANSRNKNMQMSVLGCGTHRLVPSPIKLPKSEQQKQQQPHEHLGVKRRASQQAGLEQDELQESVKKARSTCDKISVAPTPPKHQSVRSTSLEEPAYEENTIISPASSNEGQKSPSTQRDGQHKQHHHAHPSHPFATGPYSLPPRHHFPSPAAQPWIHPSRAAPPGYYPVPTSYGPPHPYYTIAMHHQHHHPHSYAPPPLQQPNVVMSAPPQKNKEDRDNQLVDEGKNSHEDWQKTRSEYDHKNRCVPVDQPSRARKPIGNPEQIEEKLPDFPQLVNFPEHLTRGQTRGTGDHKGLAPEGKRHCVMCGQLRICSSSANRLNRSTAPAEGADSTVHIIPRQNKGVCTACDVTVWNVKDSDDLEIKWCKGCKNFRPWPAFGDKGMATKCARCRHRQREKYALQKKTTQSPSFDFQKEDDMLAAQGLSNLMRAQNA